MRAYTEQYNEEYMVSAAQSGNADAMKALYARHIRLLTALCSRYLPDADDVKDVLQDSFLKIFASLDSFEYRGQGSLKGWMTKIVLNEALKFIKRNTRLDMIPLSEADSGIAENDEPDLDGISADVIHRLIGELPTGYRTIFNLYVFEEKSHKEIAAILSIKESTSASQLHRAKALLADKIKRYQTLNATTR